MKEIVIASGNKGKIKEIAAKLAPIDCLPQENFGITGAAEHGLSFLENALIKASHVSKLSNKPALADDSGLVIPCLNGQPGIFSARFAGEHASDADNITMLLERLAFKSPEPVPAYFYCAIILLKFPGDPTPFVATGQLNGVIIHQPEGSQGFGYDPIFYLPEKKCTLASLGIPEKNQLSHRGLALNQLKTLLLQENTTYA